MYTLYSYGDSNTVQSMLYVHVLTSPTDSDCLGMEHSEGPSVFQTALITARVLSWNNRDDFNSATKSSDERDSTAADLMGRE